MVKILFVGDVVGGLGRRALLGLLPKLRADHEPTFLVEVEVGGRVTGKGVGGSKREAEQAAARVALHDLGR